jgi:hypothetical protein
LPPAARGALFEKTAPLDPLQKLLIMNQALDFTSLPIKEIILILRRLALRLLEELLAPPCEVGKVLSVKPQPELKSISTKPDIQVMSRANIWKVKYSGTQKTGRIHKNLREELPRTLNKLVIKSINGKISAHQWQIAVCNRIALALGGTKGDILPDDLWSTAAKAAWCSEDFQLSAAVTINDWLRKMRLLVPYELPFVILSPITFWVLIALAQVKPLKFHHWFSKTKRADIRVNRRLQKEAQWQMIKNEWADFWDQWIIQLASQRWPSAFSQLENRLCKALMGLPLFKTTTTDALCPKKGILKLSPWPLIEKCFDKMDGIYRLPKSQKDYRRIILLNFAVPNWEKQIPAFFKTVHYDASPT